jgi:hypothetical protein
LTTSQNRGELTGLSSRHFSLILRKSGSWFTRRIQSRVFTAICARWWKYARYSQARIRVWSWYI